MKNCIFNNIDSRVLRARLEKVLKLRSNNELAKDEINAIADAVDGQQMTIVVTRNLSQFKKNINLSYSYETDEKGKIIRTFISTGKKVLGTFVFGKTQTTKNAGQITFGGRKSIVIAKGVCAAIVQTSCTGYDSSVPSDFTTLHIYIPEKECALVS